MHWTYNISTLNFIELRLHINPMFSDDTSPVDSAPHQLRPTLHHFRSQWAQLVQRRFVLHHLQPQNRHVLCLAPETLGEAGETVIYRKPELYSSDIRVFLQMFSSTKLWTNENHELIPLMFFAIHDMPLDYQMGFVFIQWMRIHLSCGKDTTHVEKPKGSPSNIDKHGKTYGKCIGIWSTNDGFPISDS